jgi:hypothetical protein
MNLWFPRHFSGIRKLVATEVWSPRVHLVSCTFTDRESAKTLMPPCTAYGKQLSEGMSMPRGLLWNTTTRWSFLPSVFRFPKGDSEFLLCCYPTNTDGWFITDRNCFLHFGSWEDYITRVVTSSAGRWNLPSPEGEEYGVLIMQIIKGRDPQLPPCQAMCSAAFYRMGNPHSWLGRAKHLLILTLATPECCRGHFQARAMCEWQARGTYLGVLGIILSLTTWCSMPDLPNKTSCSVKMTAARWS